MTNLSSQGHWSKFSRPRQLMSKPCLPLRNYRQHDDHSCGFLAALTVAEYFHPELTPKDVLRVVQPDEDCGCDQEKFISALGLLGVIAEIEERLPPTKIIQFIRAGTPIVITVQDPEWESDHWTVIAGATEKRVWVTNYLSTLFDSMTWPDLVSVWEPKAYGLVCLPSARSANKR